MVSSGSSFGLSSLNYAQSAGLSGLNDAVRGVASASTRLSSGNALTRAGDDVAAFSVGASLRSQLSGYRAARTNLLQADSLLQVANGGLNTISDLLNRMSALATQGNTTALTSADRSNLNVEFQLLKDEIDRIASTTSFNEILLLDGSLSGENTLTTDSTSSTQATGSITFTGNPTAGQTVIVNNVSFIANTDFTIGGTPDATASNLATALTNSTNPALSGFTYEAVGTTITITAKAGGTNGNQFTIDGANATAPITVSGDATPTANIVSLSGGANDGLYAGGTTASGTIGDALVTAQNQTQASVQFLFAGNPSISDTISFDDGVGGTVDFSFVAASASSTQITIGADIDETIRNTIEALSNYTGSDDFGLRQLEFVRTDSGFTARSKVAGDPTQIDGSTVLSVAESSTNISVSASTITGGSSTGGVNTTGITNDDFIGTVNGFTATYNSADNISLSLTVGSDTYTASASDTTPASDTTVRFSSTSGGYFDVEIASGGATVGNQTQADTFADRLDAAFAGLTFTQARDLSSFTAAGDFVEASAEVRLNDFSNGVTISNVSVTAAPGAGQDAVVELTINGETYRSQSGIGDTIGKQEQITFTNLSDPTESLVFTNGTSAQDLSSTSAAAAFKSAFRTALGIGAQSNPLQLQVGTESSNTISISLSSAATDVIFNGATPDLTSQGNSATAVTTIGTAIDNVTALTARVGAYQSQVEYATAALNDTITNVDYARGLLEDTDVAEESTRLAFETLQSQSAVAVLAQLQQLNSSMLDLVKVGA